jgi:hypothetical protein
MNRKELIDVFDRELQGVENYIRFEGERNPCHIKLGEREFYVYVKNISPAYLGNDNVLRAQMTGVDSLKRIKKMDALFVMLGYDENNDVYATWNPYILKQRIGTASSPSMYSRLDLHKEVSKYGEIRKKTLNNDAEVIVIPRKKICEYLMNLDFYFHDLTYVAIGSKKRPDANAAYRELISLQNIRSYAKYLGKTNFFKDDIEFYCSAIDTLIRGNYFSRYRKLFLQYDSIDDYQKAADAFLIIEEIKTLDVKNNFVFSFSLKEYIKFLQCRDDDDDEFNPKGNEFKIAQSVDSQLIDWETSYEDQKGRLTKLKNPAMLKIIRPYLYSDYPALQSAFLAVEDFYGEKYATTMDPKDWNILFKSIDWRFIDENGNEKTMADSVKDNVHGQYEGNSNANPNTKRRSKKAKLIITFPDGTVINETCVSKTFTKFVQKVGVEAVRSLNIEWLGDNIVTPVINEQYRNGMKKVASGLYLNTASNTQKKYEQILDIKEGLDLNFKIDRL